MLLHGCHQPLVPKCAGSSSYESLSETWGPFDGGLVVARPKAPRLQAGTVLAHDVVADPHSRPIEIAMIEKLRPRFSQL